MITSLNIDNDKISGRLGNKLFQLACMIGYSEKHNMEMKIPHSWKRVRDFPNVKVINKSNVILNGMYNEPFFHYKEIPFRENVETLNIQGYFQSEKYFEHSKDKVREILTPSKEILEEVKTQWKKLNVGKKTVFVQVRRGQDYNNDYHGWLPMSYYEEAFKHFPDHDFVFFSDKIGWCKDNFSGDNFHFYDNVDPIVDMFVSAKCSNAIMANSTFSWWSAWFIENKDKKVIAPKNWFGKSASHLDTKDLYVENWVQI